MRNLILVVLLILVGASLFAQGPDVVKPGVGDVIKLSFYADNWCMVFINGKIVAVNSIDFLPHNEVTVNILPDYPMTIAILAKDNADPISGYEYSNTHVGDAGFILKMTDGTISGSNWKTKVFFKGPLNNDAAHPIVQYGPIPANWFTADFDDSSWDNATVFTSDQVKPDGTYLATDFTGASFIWSSDLLLDNTIILRTTVQAPKGYVKKWNTVPDLDINDVFSEAQLATVPSPNLFMNNAAGLGMGYITRVRDGQTTNEEIAQVNNGVVTALPVDLGPDTDQVFLTVLGSNLGSATSGTATIGGIAATLSYAGPQGGTAGLAQFVLPIPRSLAGQGTVPISITAGGSTSNTVIISVR
jgi:uncharacterized protein (TIGR03437 family)